MQGIAAGDNAINLCNRLKEDISVTIGDSSLDTYYSTVIGVLGSQVKDAERMADNQKLVTDNLLELRESISGVNQEEELTDMIRFQKAYDAASRILTAMDELLDRLINATGRVGA
jgi:flagellar hook-associated protein 1 FlgK